MQLSVDPKNSHKGSVVNFGSSKNKLRESKEKEFLSESKSKDQGKSVTLTNKDKEEEGGNNELEHKTKDFRDINIKLGQFVASTPAGSKLTLKGHIATGGSAYLPMGKQEIIDKSIDNDDSPEVMKPKHQSKKDNESDNEFQI